MAHRIHHLNKKTGVTYVYESTAYWDKQKKQPRNKQICIGKLSSNGKFIPSQRLKPEQAALRDPAVTATTEIIGPSLILNQITKQLGLKQLLKTCFPLHYEQIQTMAYYLAISGGALSHCETWCKQHAPELAATLTSQRISEILSSISMDAKLTFITKWLKRISEGEYFCYDLTSISSYADFNEHIKYGYNRDREQLPQLNLAMLFGQKSRLPAYYQPLPGNIPDVVTLNNLLRGFKALGAKKMCYIMDKGFYSQRNITQLLEEHHKFVIAVPIHNHWVQKEIDKIHEYIHTPHGYQRIDQEIFYINSGLCSWGTSSHRCYLHLYYNAQARATAIDRFCETLLSYKEELERGQLNEQHREAYNAYFIVKKTPKRGIKVSYNEEAVAQYTKRYAGFQAIFTNTIKDPLLAIQIYRDKDSVEKCFDDLKNQLDMKRLRMHSSASVNGRLFIQFLALIYISALRKQLRDCELNRDYTVRELLQEMESLSKIKYSGKYGFLLTEITKPQREILASLNIQVTSKT